MWKADRAYGSTDSLSAQARDRFQHAFRTFELKETDDLETPARQLVAGLEKNPALLYSLRGGKLAADAAVVGARDLVHLAAGVVAAAGDPARGVGDAPDRGARRPRGGRGRTAEGAEPPRGS